MELNTSIIVSCDFTNGRDESIVLVGKQHKEQVEIINAFQGEKALDIWNTLTKREVE